MSQSAKSILAMPGFREHLLHPSLPNGNVFQVGSTTWLRHFLSLTNTSQRKELNKFERGMQASMMAFLHLCICICIINLARASLSFSMVRHPFERIVSAYKDKVISRTFSLFSFFEIFNWDGVEEVWNHTRTICNALATRPLILL